MPEDNAWRVSNQKGVSPLYIMLEIHHSGQEPLIRGLGPESSFSCICLDIFI